MAIEPATFTSKAEFEDLVKTNLKQFFHTDADNPRFDLGKYFVPFE